MNHFDAVFERIKEETHIRTQSHLSHELGMKESSISRAKKSGEFPDAWAVRICRKYNLSIDFMIHGETPRTEINSFFMINLNGDKPNFRTNLKKLMIQKGDTDSQLSKEMDIPEDVIEVWKYSKLDSICLPTPHRLQALAKRYGVTPVDLIGGAENWEAMVAEDLGYDHEAKLRQDINDLELKTTKQIMAIRVSREERLSEVLVDCQEQIKTVLEKSGFKFKRMLYMADAAGSNQLDKETNTQESIPDENTLPKAS